jgi:hypothetical protein
MKIIGTENLTREQVQHELSKRGKFVVYPYCISLLVITFKRSSDIYFVTADKPFTGARLSYSLLSFVAGWWGIPWGPIWTAPRSVPVHREEVYERIRRAESRDPRPVLSNPPLP